MNRAAKCIEMLNLLRAHRIMKKSELARRLNTNERNIREFKYELQAAGYEIVDRRGRYGGLELRDAGWFPVLRLDDKEMAALRVGCDLLEGRSEFIQKDDYERAMTKVFNAHGNNLAYEKTRMVGTENKEPDAAGKFVDLFRQAAKENRKCSILYRKRDAQQAEWLEIDPYEVVHYEDAWYVIAYAPARNGYRMYKIISTRMLDAKLLDAPFARDSYFNVNEIVGKASIVKGHLKQYKVDVKQKREHIFLEQSWGQDLCKEEEHDGWVRYSFWRDEELQLFNLLFLMNEDVRLVSPEDARSAYLDRLAGIAHLYEGNEG